MKGMMKENEEAVSPVVGVMLMLVVTIIIAAVVSGFAGGLVKDNEKAPQASLQCNIKSSDMGLNYGFELIIKHLSGEPLNTGNLKLVTSWVDADGDFHVQSTVAPIYVETEEIYYSKPGEPVAASHYNLTSLNTHYTTSKGGFRYYHAPYKVSPGDSPADNSTEEETLWFGNYVFRSGDIMKAITNLNPGTGNYTNQAIPVIKDVDLLTGNDIVNVKLIDQRSGSTIFNKDVLVEV